MDFEPVIGLEIHAQLLTSTKIFCGCSASFGAPPNTHVCPVCLGLPGALPVLNERAVEFAVRAALALGCRVHDTSVFARKNYFYPDLPKGYQISQFEQPLATGGRIEFVQASARHAVGITRLHLEEDAGKSLHVGFPDSDRKTYVDFNRSGVPLVEIVSEPDLRSAADAAGFFERLRAVLVTVGVNDGNMEEGSLRCDANVSVRTVGQDAFGVKTEIKNLNSFRYVQKALEHEIERQVAVIRNGGVVRQETRLWDPASARTVAMRSKEESHDYRYFPEPDLPPLRLAPGFIARVQQDLPELPEQRKARFISAYALPEYDAQLLTQSVELGDYFEQAAAASGNAKAASNWIMGELLRKMNALGVSVADVRVTPAALAGLIRLIDVGTISGAMAKDVFEKMYASGRPADAIVAEEGLSQISDDTVLVALVRDVVAAHPGPVAQYRSGRAATLGFLVGQVMKSAGGKANPKRVNELLRAELDAG